MNCFEWQNRSSDYLDGALIGATQREADEHVENCSECRRRLERYRQIVHSISDLPRAPLPIPMRKAPLSFAIPKIDLGSLTRSGLLERSPWFVRTSVEGLGVAFVLLFLIAVVPRIRTLYERGIERRLDAFSLNDPLNKETTGNPGPSRGRLGIDGLAQSDEFSGEYGEEEAPESQETEADSGETGEVRVGSSEIWRFNLKTDSPQEVQPKIVQLLRSLGVAAETPGLGGIEAPGGIQFDILVPTHIVSNLRTGLKKLASPPPAGVENGETNSPSSTFTWYKNKSKRKIPPGKARVVIWLSQV